MEGSQNISSSLKKRKVLHGNDTLQIKREDTLQKNVIFQKANLIEMSTLTQGYVHFDKRFGAWKTHVTFDQYI
jgi:hypothetical protein